MTTLSPSSISRLYQPSKCELRTWLLANDYEEGPESDFQRFIKEQGLLHEARVLERLKANHPNLIDLDGYNNKDAGPQTIEAVAAGGQLIYQAKLVSDHQLGGEMTRILGYPDFLIPDGDGWIIADAKLASSIYNKPRKDGSCTPNSDKYQIFLQLQLYGWLFAQTFKDTPFKLHVYTGDGSIEEVEYDGGGEALATLAHVLALQQLTSEPTEMVGWTKCGGCGFREHCWPRAIDTNTLGYVADLPVKLGKELTAAGITSYTDLLEKFDEQSLAEFKAGEKGKPANQLDSARRLIENITALTTGETVRRRDVDGNVVPIPSEVTSDDYYVMFDLEGAQPDMELPQIVYLWGMQVYGKEKGEFRGAVAGFDENGDEQGWSDFLKIAAELMDTHPGIRFVYWTSYEKTAINRYLGKYGDDDAGTAAKVLDSLLDLHPITKATVAMPIPSYSLKVVEKAVGFERQVDDVAKGDESIVAFTEACETEDVTRREEIMESIRAYNEEDLEATWAVQQWLAGLGD